MLDHHSIICCNFLYLIKNRPVNETDATLVGKSITLLSMGAKSAVLHVVLHVYSILVNTLLFFLFYRPRFSILQKKGEDDWTEGQWKDRHKDDHLV